MRVKRAKIFEVLYLEQSPVLWNNPIQSTYKKMSTVVHKDHLKEKIKKRI